jgi:hypothetical protein
MPLLPHLRQDEVGRAVDDARDPLDAVRGESFAQRLDDRYAAGNGSLESDHDTFPLCRGKDLVAMCGEQRLVGSNHVLAVLDCLQHEFPRHAIAADEFDDNIDFRIRHDRKRVVGDACCAFRHLSRQIEILVGNNRDADRAPRAPRDLFFVACEHRERAAAHSADAEQSYVDGFHVIVFPKQNEEGVCPAPKIR